MPLPLTEIQLGELNLDLAWRRARADKEKRWFVEHPYLIDWIARDTPGWLAQIRTSLQNGHGGYDNSVCFVPKPGWMVRPGSALDYRDAVVYAALVGRFLPRALEVLQASQGVMDMAYQLNPDPEAEDWMDSAFNGWEHWTEVSLEKVQRGATHVLVADIAGFYDNINIQMLASRLNEISPGQNFLDNLTARLNRWTKSPGKGIPQGHSASDVLAKLFFSPIDQGLNRLGFDHIRYVDDIRIFCGSHLEAQRALVALTTLLHSNGLTLQSAKTKIMSAEEARGEFDGVAPIIDQLQLDVKDELTAHFGANPYISADEIEELLEQHAQEIDAEVFEAAFRNNFTAPRTRFNKTLLHYLLTRLRRLNSRVAVEYCLELIETRPEEMEYVLKYLKGFTLEPAAVGRILTYMESTAAIYDFQLYELVKWFHEREDYPPRLATLCRAWYFDRNRAPWLRTYSLLVIAHHSVPADLDRVLGEYDAAHSNCERAEIAYALRNVEIARRNAFYGRVRGDSNLVARAIQAAQQA